MKTKLLLLFFGLFCLVANASEAPASLRAQLEDLNRFWIGRSVSAVVNALPAAKSEVELIQAHLSLVEFELRKKNTSHLSVAQRTNRLKCLDILHGYWLNGVFPQNIYHQQRTPYFIDHLGTACAVGQLIVSTGFESLARTISNENNYGYIYDLVKKYPSISQWANDYGFEVSELAWIQPCYCAYDKVETRNVSCNGGYDGYFKPDMSAITNVQSIKSFRWVNSDWQEMWVMCGFCNIPAGKYKLVVRDDKQVDHSFEAEIFEPAPPVISISTSGDASKCAATAVVSVSNSTNTISYFWTGTTSNNNTATNLCQQSYTVEIKENNHCYHKKEFDLGNLTGINEHKRTKLEIYPNPVKEILEVNIPNLLKDQDLVYSVYNSIGVLCYEGHAPVTSSSVDLSGLQAGVYFLKVKSGGDEYTTRFIKE